jgi:glycosyltransferase involved in cell wall biosynthesis
MKSSRNIIYCSPYFDASIPSGANRRALELLRRFDREFGGGFELIVARGKKPPELSKASVHEIDYEPQSILSKLKARGQIAKILDSHASAIFVNEFLPIPFESVRRHSHFQMVYDLRYFTENQTLRYRMMYARPLKRQWLRSEHIVTCSEFTKGELVRVAGCRPEAISISYFGIDEKLVEQPERKPEKDIDILFVGHFEKRKNHANLLKALAMVDKGLRVELIGVDGGLKGEIEVLAQELGFSHIHMFTLNDDAKLWEYYRRARLFVFPSRYEGFGIPLIESLALGTPVACSDIPVFREIGGEFVDYFDPQDLKSMATVISNALDRPRILDADEIKKFLHRYRWNAIYEKFVDDLMAFSTAPQVSYVDRGS